MSLSFGASGRLSFVIVAFAGYRQLFVLFSDNIHVRSYPMFQADRLQQTV